VPGVVVISRVDESLVETLPSREPNAVSVQLFRNGAVDELEYSKLPLAAIAIVSSMVAVPFCTGAVWVLVQVPITCEVTVGCVCP
jgi:hypothetical protein